MRSKDTQTRRLAVTALALAGVLAACGDDDDTTTTDASGEAGDATPDSTPDTTADDTTADDTTADDTTADDTTPATTTGDVTPDTTTDDAAENTATGEVPDPCTLVPADELSAILGSDPGEGSVQAVTPEQRKVCMYSSGLILAVEVGENYEVSVELMQDVAPVEDVSGVGEAAGWQDVGGGIGQFVARGDNYFVGVTITTGGKAAGQAVAEAMLAAL